MARNELVPLIEGESALAIRLLTYPSSKSIFEGVKELMLMLLYRERDWLTNDNDHSDSCQTALHACWAKVSYELLSFLAKKTQCFIGLGSVKYMIPPSCLESSLSTRLKPCDFSSIRMSCSS